MHEIQWGKWNDYTMNKNTIKERRETDTWAGVQMSKCLHHNGLAVENRQSLDNSLQMFHMVTLSYSCKCREYIENYKHGFFLCPRARIYKYILIRNTALIYIVCFLSERHVQKTQGQVNKGMWNSYFYNTFTVNI